MFTFVSVDSSPRSYSFTYASVRIPVHIATKSGINLSDMWRSIFKDRRGVAQLGAVKEIAPKSTFWCVNRSPLRWGFRVGARAVGYRVTIASVLLHSATRQLNFHFNQYGRLWGTWTILLVSLWCVRLVMTWEPKVSIVLRALGSVIKRFLKCLVCDKPKTEKGGKGRIIGTLNKAQAGLKSYLTRQASTL